MSDQQLELEAFKKIVEECGGKGNKKNTNPKDRMSADRLDLSLFPVLASAYGALAMTEGGLKYGPFNWREPGEGVRATVYYAACRRHMDKWLSREWEDPDTGVPHLASALACIAILIDAMETGCLKDDRPKFHPGDRDMFAGVMRMLTDKAKHLHKMFPQAQAQTQTPTPEPSSPLPSFPMPPALSGVDKDGKLQYTCSSCQAVLMPTGPARIDGTLPFKCTKCGLEVVRHKGPTSQRETQCKNCGEGHARHLPSNGACIDVVRPRWDPQEEEPSSPPPLERCDVKNCDRPRIQG